MKFGLNTFSTDFGIHPAELGQILEALGFESLLFAEHSHIPANRQSQFPYGGDIDQSYWHNFDPFIALTMVAAATKHLRIGTGICLVVERDPITLAKEVATLDYLSGGRFMFGVGGGWNLEEMKNHGTDPQLRWKVLNERIEAMKTIWAQDEPTYHGEFVSFDPLWQWPKPIQKPHPPILVGGDGPNTLKRVVRYGDGWMPVAVYEPHDLTVFKQRVATLNQLAADAGRDPIPVTIMGMLPELDVLKRYEDAGVERILFWLLSDVKEKILPILENYADLIRRFD
jgi:probable F420-dependent oxidoreductase